ncbi:MAG: hypothetical protein AAF585_02045 [Verrucomicrobiota bacterium]
MTAGFEQSESTRFRQEWTQQRRRDARTAHIAFWMLSCLDNSTSPSKPPTLSKETIRDQLAEFIQRSEPLSENETPDEIAENFLESICGRSGPLIEIDGSGGHYAFVKLAYQEDLAASYINDQIELRGVEPVWGIIDSLATKNHWQKVIRLVMRKLLNPEAQRIQIEKLIPQAPFGEGSFEKALLTVNFYLDGVDGAVVLLKDILIGFFHSIGPDPDCDLANRVAQTCKELRASSPVADREFVMQLEELCRNGDSRNKSAWLSLGLAAGLDRETVCGWTGKHTSD